MRPFTTRVTYFSFSCKCYFSVTQQYFTTMRSNYFGQNIFIISYHVAFNIWKRVIIFHFYGLKSFDGALFLIKRNTSYSIICWSWYCTVWSHLQEFSYEANWVFCYNFLWCWLIVTFSNTKPDKFIEIYSDILWSWI